MRLGRSEEMARCVMFLGSDDSLYGTGSCLVLDGGLTAFYINFFVVSCFDHILRIWIAVMDHYSLYINGESWDTGTYLTVTDKANGAPWATISQAGAKEVDAAVTAASQVFANKPLTVAQRYEILTKAAALIRSRNKDLPLTMAYEAGKPLPDALAEVERAADTFTWAGEEAKRIHGEMVPLEATPGSENRLAFTIRVPVGVVCAITPFNFPINLVAHKVAPALAAGNAVVLKPASYTPIVPAKLCAIMADAALPT